jgi:hypothetical protein
MEIKKIREAVLANRGGLEVANDEQIMVIWQHLPADIQKQYLESINDSHKDTKTQKIKDI